MSTHFLNKEEQDFYENLKDWKWRIQNLYYIKTKQGKKVLFTPNWAQKIIIDNLWFFSVILKARQLGMTTFFCILYLDQVLFNANKTAGIIAHRKEDAEKFFDDKVKFAWDNLPPMLQEHLGPPNTDSAKELSFPNGSKIFVSTSTRGGTLQYLHLSEFGKVCAQYPQKAKEIVTGAINSVEQGCFVTIESTAEGRSGYFFDYCQEAQQAVKDKRTLSPMEFRFFFFPWWKNPEYRLKGAFPINKEFEEYFNNLEKLHGVDKLDDEQKRWYIVKKKNNGEDMFREYPSTADEAFMASIEGSYFATNMGRVYEDQRIRNIPYDSRYLVDTHWDLGMNDTNTIIFTQAVGNEIRIIDCYGNSGEGLGHYVSVLKDRGYTYGQHNFPHDIEVKELGTGVSRRQTLMDLQVRNIRTIERTKNINDDIEAIRKLFSRFYFDEAKTAPLVEALNNYKKEWDEKLGEFKNYPRHDKHSHWADAMRVLALSWKLHNASIGSQNKEEIVSFF